MGDLILSPTGVVGQLVNRTFELLNATPRGTISVCSKAYGQLEVYPDKFQQVALETPGGSMLEAYQLLEPDNATKH
jgi:hypothetical protein